MLIYQCEYIQHLRPPPNNFKKYYFYLFRIIASAIFYFIGGFKLLSYYYMRLNKRNVLKKYENYLLLSFKSYNLFIKLPIIEIYFWVSESFSLSFSIFYKVHDKLIKPFTYLTIFFYSYIYGVNPPLFRLPLFS